MKSQREPDLSLLTGCARKVADWLSAGPIEDEELQRDVEEILFGEKEVWAVISQRLVTRREAAELLLANLESRLVHRFQLSRGEGKNWRGSKIVRETEAALFGDQV
jgi:hypothetical protein